MQNFYRPKSIEFRREYFIKNTETDTVILKETFKTLEDAKKYADSFNKYYKFEKYVVVRF